MPPAPVAPFEGLRHRSPQVRDGVAAEGLFAWARKVLPEEQLLTFRLALQVLNLPRTAKELRDLPGFDVNFVAIWEIILGLAPEITDANYFSLDGVRFAGATVTTDLSVGGRFRLGGDGTVGGAAGVQGLIQVPSSAPPPSVGTLAATAGNIGIAGGANFGALPNPTPEAGWLKAENEAFILALRFPRRSSWPTARALADTVGADAGALFLDERGDPQYTKLRYGSAPNDARVKLSAPLLDTGWGQFVAHHVGDTTTNPPYEITYPLGILPNAFAGPGDQLGAVDVQVWTRRHSTYLPLRVGPATRSHSTASSGVVGTQFWYDLTDGIRLVVQGSGLARQGLTVLQEFRVMVWLRGSL